MSEREAKWRVAQSGRERKRAALVAAINAQKPAPLVGDGIRVERGERTWCIGYDETQAFVDLKKNLEAYRVANPDDDFAASLKGMRDAAAELRQQAAELIKTAELVEQETSLWQQADDEVTLEELEEIYGPARCSGFTAFEVTAETEARLLELETAREVAEALLAGDGVRCLWTSYRNRHDPELPGTACSYWPAMPRRRAN
jgi:hypothetical protein